MEHSRFVASKWPRRTSTFISGPGDEGFRVSHDEPGLRVLVERLRPHQPSLVVLEATGGYEITVRRRCPGLACPSPS